MEIVNFTENVLSIFRRIAIALEKQTSNNQVNFNIKGANKKEIDWEQRRYEVARDIYVHALIKDGYGHSWSSRYSHEAVEMADELITELKKQPYDATKE